MAIKNRIQAKTKKIDTYQWITLDEAEEIVKGFYSRQSIYRMISMKRLDRRGPFHCAFIRKDQLLKVTKLEGLVDAEAVRDSRP